MSGSDSRVVQEFTEELDKIPRDEASPLVRVGETSVSLEVGSSGQGLGLGEEDDKAYQGRLLIVKGIEDGLLGDETLEWYDIWGSYINPAHVNQIRERSGMPSDHDILIPEPTDRAHTPPPGYHTFYTNQVTMGLRFPVPSLIRGMCDHFGVSPSQILPNSYATLLSLGVLFKFFGVKLTVNAFLKFVMISRSSMGRFYFSLMPEHPHFLDSNPTSHKGWPNNYFYVRAPKDFRWRCKMSWAEGIHAREAPISDPDPNLPRFLRIVSSKIFRTTSLVQDDLLCHFGFCRKGVQVEEAIGRVGSVLELTFFYSSLYTYVLTLATILLQAPE